MLHWRSECITSVVICPPAVFLESAEHWKWIKSVYPHVLVRFFLFATLSARPRVDVQGCTCAITQVSEGPFLDNDVFEPLPPQRSDRLCLEHHLQSIVLVNQAQVSGHRRSSSKDTPRIANGPLLNIVSVHVTESQTGSSNRQQWQEKLCFIGTKPRAGPGSYMGNPPAHGRLMKGRGGGEGVDRTWKDKEKAWERKCERERYGGTERHKTMQDKGVNDIKHWTLKSAERKGKQIKEKDSWV